MDIKEKQNEQPIFSIIIPMKNADKYIRNALDSIANQQFDNIQVIVIDDNSDSTDISRYLVHSWINHHPNINLQLFQTKKEQGGPGGARNIGLDNANGKYILFLNADDTLNENALHSIKKAIDENQNTDIFVLGYQLTRRDCYENDKKTYSFSARKISFICVSSWLIQKAFRNNIDRKRQQKKAEKQTLEDEITLGM